jgi:uncharacterized damage-inducible protein DinB
MKLLNTKFALILIASLIIPSACAQDATAKPAAVAPAPRPAHGPAQTLLWFWNDVGRKLTAMAEDFPEDKYDFKPSPVQRSFAEQLIHAAKGNYIFLDIVKGVKPNYEDPKRSEFKNKAAVVEYLRKSFADGAALITNKGDSGINDLVVDPSNQYYRVSEEAWAIIEHAGEHYGQLVVYYRVAGLVPPESRPKK